MFTTQQLLALGEQIADSGADRHGHALQLMADTIRTVAPGTAEVLVDPSAPQVLRQRAFAVAAGVLIRGSHRAQSPV